MPLYWRNKVLLAKVETVYGTDSAPTGAANAILATDVRIMPMEGQDVSRELDSRPWMGASDTIPVGLHAKISFKSEVKGSGAAGTAPAIGPLLRACAMAEVVSAGVSVTYSKVTSNHASATIWLNIDGTLFALTGARGTAVYRVNASGIAYMEFEFWGLFVQPAAAAMPTPTYGVQLTQMPQAASSANTPTFTVGGVTLVLRSFALDFGNVVVPRMLIRSESILITDMSEKIDMTVEAEPLATLNPFALAAAGTAQVLSLVHGVGAGRITTLAVPQGVLQRPTGLEVQDNIVEWPLSMIPRAASAGSQFTLAFT